MREDEMESEGMNKPELAIEREDAEEQAREDEITSEDEEADRDPSDELVDLRKQCKDLSDGLEMERKLRIAAYQALDEIHRDQMCVKEPPSDPSQKVTGTLLTTFTAPGLYGVDCGRGEVRYMVMDDKPIPLPVKIMIRKIEE
jgi:hypothetical protein